MPKRAPQLALTPTRRRLLAGASDGGIAVTYPGRFQFEGRCCDAALAELAGAGWITVPPEHAKGLPQITDAGRVRLDDPRVLARD